MATIADILQLRARRQSDDLAYAFLHDGKISQSLTYLGLDQRARAIAARLLDLDADGPVLLLYPSGLDFIAAFFGCLYAGVTAVPLFPPRRNRPDARLAAVIADVRAKIALMPAQVRRDVEQRSAQLPELNALHCLAIDGLTGSPAASPACVRDSDAPAYLQYTSGSTSTPKGVAVSHAGLMQTMADFDRGFDHRPGSVMVTWLPLFHDLGLIYGILQPLHSGFPCYLMDPAAFSQRPVRWLQALSAYGGTHSAAPNFAYELCVRSISEAEKTSLDLRRWEVALNAAEPVHEETMRRFTAAFAGCGFTSNAFCPGYGLAESTLKVTAARRGAGAKILRVRTDPLSRGSVEIAEPDEPDAKTLVGCGVSEIGARIAIVDPETMKECPAPKVGEVWVKSEVVAEGYWQRPAETEETFAARLADTGEGPFLRTGDLGCLHGGELFITGRLKDIIIIRGMNYYPQDIELTVERCHPALRPGAGAAFALDSDGEERLIVAHEVERTRLRNLDPDEIVRAIRTAVAREHDLTVHAVALLRPASIPKTSSGKIQRRACRAEFQSGRLKLVAQWQQPSAPDASRPTAPAATGEPHSAEGIERWILQRLGERTGLRPSQLDPREPFVTLGLDSLSAVRLSGEIEEWLGRKLAPTIAFEYPTPEALARFLMSGSSNRKPIVAGETNHRTHEPIAIIGMACRFPGAPNVDSFWRVLSSGADGPAPPRAARLADMAANGCGSASAMPPGHFLDAIDQFDAEFFGLAPREAQSMDPQQRLLLEVAWEAMEDAGQAGLAGSSTGVFVGISSSDYSRLLFRAEQPADAYYGTGSALSIAANRLSYVLDLHGPSWAVDTACSSSLVAVHNACQALRLGECDLAFAGGVNLVVSPELTAALAEARMLSGDGRCKTFDAAADGYGRGEGCGIILLKRHADAVRDGDEILALIAGSAVNQDGRSNGLTAPNGLAQQEVIRRALDNAGIEPGAISYVETHGTGTPLGDPIEINALKTVLAKNRTGEQPCCFGSVKTNIGHLEAAAGIAGLIKVVLCLKHGELAPHLHLNTLNPYVELDGTPFSIPTAPQPWPSSQRPRTAGVSSFGFGGTNAHVVLREAEPAGAADSPNDAAEPAAQILALSAKNPDALRELAGAYVAYLDAHPDVSLARLCFSANAGREHFRHRGCLVADSAPQLRDQLTVLARGDDAPAVLAAPGPSSSRPKPVFLFTGQGSHYPGMGHELFRTELRFRRALQECDSILGPLLETPLLDVLYGAPKQSELLEQTAYAQPALFALEYALSVLWRSWGIEPAAVMGHSLGEYVAACVAGVFSLEDGLKLVAERGRLMHAAPGKGHMAAVFADAARVADIIGSLPDDLSIAALNGPGNTVVSGSAEAIAAAIQAFAAKGIATQLLRTSHAFHSALMDPAAAAFRRVASTVTYHRPRIDLISNLSGTLASAELTNPDYWCRQMRQPVQFAAGIASLAERGHRIFIELGPHPVLTAQARECVADESDFAWIASLRRNHSDQRQMLESVSSMYLRGVRVDWRGLYEGRDHRRLNVPTYPFQRQRYWVSSPDGNQGAVSSEESLPRVMTGPLDTAGTDVPASRAARAGAAAHEELNGSNVQRDEGAQVRKQAHATARVDLVPRLQEAAPTERLNMLISHIQAEVSDVLHVPAGRRIDVTQGFFDMGFDSLTAMEFKKRLDTAVRRQLSPSLAFDFPTIASLAGHLLQMLAPSASRHAPQRAAMPDETMANIIALSESELESFVDEELRRSGQ